MRRIVVLTAFAALVTMFGASPAMSAAKKPVKLEGTVNVHGTKDVSKKTTATLEVELDDFSFGPTFIKAKRGEIVTLELANEGNAPHTFTSDTLDVDEELAPGAKTSVEITVPTSGNAFRFFCQFHQGSGMQGAVFTKSGSKATAAGTSGAGRSSSSGTGSGSPAQTPSYGY